jgi:hypothetical protein
VLVLANRNPVKDRACNCQILKKQEGLGEKMKDGIKKEISRVRDKRTKRQTRQAGQSGQEGEGGEGDASYFGNI